jgi:uncharacterized protein
MKTNPVVWFEIYVQNMDRVRLFYESVLQCKLEKLDSPGLEMWAFPMNRNAAGATGALVSMQGVPSGGNSTLVYFACEDCSVEEGRVITSGGRVHKKKFSIGQYGFISLVIDTEGNMFGLHSNR